GGILGSGSNVPAFLTKLWTLVEDPDTDPLICWSPVSGEGQGKRGRPNLPHYLEHKNIRKFTNERRPFGPSCSFGVMQTSMNCGCASSSRSCCCLTSSSSISSIFTSFCKSWIARHFTHTWFSSTGFSRISHIKQVSQITGLKTMLSENKALWREVASLRQKHAQQQKVVNKLIQFLISLVQSNRVLGMKRKIPLMLNDSSSAHSMPKYSRQYSLEPLQGSPAFSPTSQSYTGANLFSDSSVNCGPIISDVTDLPQLSPSASPNDQTEDDTSPAVLIKEEPLSPDVELIAVDETPVSPTTFIDSLLEDSEASGASAGSSSAPARDGERCLSLACVDNLRRSPQMSEVTCVFPSPSSSLHLGPEQGNDLSEHLETIDSNLENLQTILTGQSISFDSSPLFDVIRFSRLFEKEMYPIPSHIYSPPLQIYVFVNAGKQLVQYTAQPVFLLDPSSADEGSADLPNLFELDDDNSYFGAGDDSEDPTISLLSNTTYQSKTKDP
ncbi:HSF1 protein, partial [Polyodon spathula]|nr:HSF1 protein [Polyodon spathula]